MKQGDFIWTGTAIQFIENPNGKWWVVNEDLADRNRANYMQGTDPYYGIQAMRDRQNSYKPILSEEEVKAFDVVNKKWWEFWK